MISVLYVDDEPALCDVAKIFLEENGGFSVTTAASAKEALAIPGILQYDAIVSDYLMPKMDGIAFLKEIRQQSTDIPFILFTGRGREEIVIEAINNGADFYLQKGGEPEAQFAELGHKVRQAVARRKSENEIISIFRAVRVGIGVVKDRILVRVNDHLCTITGYPREELEGRNTRFLYLSDEDYIAVGRMREQAYRQGSAEDLEIRWRRRDGAIIDVRITAALIDRSNPLAPMTYSALDITEEKQAHRKLKESYEQLAAAEEELRKQYDELARNGQQIRMNEERLVMAQEIGRTGSWEYTIGTGGIWGSSEGLRIFGFHEGAGDLPIAVIEACIPERERVHQALVDLIEKGSKYNLEYTVKPADGSAPRVVHSVARLEKDPGGKPLRVVGVVQDITERKQREEEIACNNAILSTQQETSPDAILIVDEHGKIINYNRQFLTVWGVPEDLIAEGADEPVLRYVTGQLEDPDAFLSRVKFLYDHREEKSFDELSLKDGRVLERFSSPMLGETGKYFGRVWYFRDITRRKRTEAALGESESRLRSLIDATREAVILVDEDGKIIEWNPGAEKLSGISRTEAIGKSSVDLTFRMLPREERTEERRTAVRDAIQTLIRTGVPPFEGSMVAPAMRADGTRIITRQTIFPIPAGRGFRFGAIIQDITGERKAEEALRESEQRFRNLIQNSSDMIRIIGRDGMIAYSSPSTLRLFGYDPAEVIGKDPLDFVHADDRAFVKDALWDVFGEINSGVPTEYRIRHKDGHYIDVEAIASNQLKTPGIEGVVITTRPITERKKGEASLRESESRFSTTFHSSPVALALVSATDGTFIDVNDAFLASTGYSRHEVIGSMAVALGIFADRTEYKRFSTILRSQRTVHGMELKCRRKNGEIRTCRFSSGIVMMNGRPVILSSVEDVTEFKKAEEVLRESEDRFRRLADNAPDMIYRMSLPEGKYEYISPASVALTGYSPEDFYANPDLIRSIIHPGWQEYFRKQWEALLQKAAPPFYEFQIIDRAGNTRWVNQRNVLVSDDQGNPVAIEGIVTEVTRQKNAEQELRRSELRSLALSENAGSWIWEVDPEGVYRYSSPVVHRILGYRPEDLVGKMHFYDLFDPSVREDLKAAAQKAFSSREPFRDFVNLNRHRDGTPVILSTSGTPVFDEDGTFTGYCGADEDITERTAAQSAMQAIVRSMVGTTGLDSLRKITGNVSSWLGADCVIVGEIQPDRLTVKALSMLLDGKEIRDFSWTLRGTPAGNVVEKGYCVYPDNVMQLFPASGGLQELKIRGYLGTPLRDSRGDVIGVLSVLSRNPARSNPHIQEIMDIIAVKAAAEIERIRIERELHESRHLLAKAMALTSLVNWEVDPETGRFIFNDRFYALYGTSSEQEGGYGMAPEKYIREFVHPDDRDAVAAMITSPAALADPDFDAQMEHRIVRRDGEIRHILVRVGITKDPEGKILRVHGANQDITERKRAEEALRQAHKKLHLLSGITRHDILNQLLTLNGYVGILRKKIPDPQFSDIFTRITKTSSQISTMIAFTREYEKIGVQAPVWQAFASVVNSAGAGILPGQVTLTNNLPAGTEVYADPLVTRVVFNLLDNSIRHGQHVTEIRVSSRRSGDDLIITWEDNGIGIPAGEKDLVFEKGFGKNTGLGLFLAREILSLTGITITENGIPGTGARFEITVPRGAYRNAPE